MVDIPNEQIEYYKANSGQSGLSPNVWYLNPDKRHAFAVYSDYDALDEANNKITMEPVDQNQLLVNSFSTQVDPILYRTKYVSDDTDGEDVTLELDRRVLTFVVDQSGSMTWNDNSNLRYDVAKDMIQRMGDTYPGIISYNLIEYAGRPITLTYFAVPESDQVTASDADSLAAAFFATDDSGFNGVRVIQNNEHYPTSPLDGDIIFDGYISKVFDNGLTEGEEYFYTVFTKDSHDHFSTGVNIKATVRERIIPRGVAILHGETMKGSGPRADVNSVLMCHFDEEDENRLYSFDSNDHIFNYTHSTDDPIWLPQQDVPSGKSGVRFNGIDYFQHTETNTWGHVGNQFSIAVWVYVYEDDYSIRTIVERYHEDIPTIDYALYTDNATREIYLIVIHNNGGAGWYSAVSDSGAFQFNQWHHIVVTVDASSNGAAVGNECLLYVDGELSTMTTSGFISSIFNPAENYLNSVGGGSIAGGTGGDGLGWFGKISDVSVINGIVNADFISTYSVSNIDDNGEIIEEDTDNGDRLNALKYEIGSNYNYVGGEVKIIKKENSLPSWDGDEAATIVLTDTNPAAGTFYLSDIDDLVFSETVNYRAYSQNSLGNVSYPSDSPTVSLTIPTAGSVLFLPEFVASEVFEPTSLVAESGKKKIYLTWSNYIESNEISRIRIFYKVVLPGAPLPGEGREANFPTVDANGESDGELIFSGKITDEEFVHRNLQNNYDYYYTLVNIDVYGRPSPEHFTTVSATPSSDATDIGIPLLEVQHIRYEIVNNRAISIAWDQSYPTAKDIDVYLDQRVLFYAALTDEFGNPIPEEAAVDMTISAAIQRSTGKAADFDLICSGGTIASDVSNEDLYEFAVTKENGIIQGILSMTRDAELLGLVDVAKFDVQISAVIPRPSSSGTSASEDTAPDSLWSQLLGGGIIDELLGTEDEGTDPSKNLFEFKSSPIEVTMTNPFFMELHNIDRKYISERCYLIEEIDDPMSMMKAKLKEEWMSYNGIYVGASNPFVLRVIMYYQGVSLAQNAEVQVKVCDATVALCAGEGTNIAPSKTVAPPSATMKVSQGTDADGNAISFVDIPFYTPDAPQAVNIHIRGIYLGYEVVNVMYVVFHNTLRINLFSEGPRPDGQHLAEQKAIAYHINPDSPRDTSSYISVSDNTIVKWENIDRNDWVVRTQEDLERNDDVEGNPPIPFFSIDNVPVAGGVYSYTRSGTARNVFFGPADAVLPPFELYEISATITDDGQTSISRDTVQIIGQLNPREDLAFGNKFLMEMDIFTNYIWGDGQDYVKIYISRDPATSITKWSNCFVECAASQDANIYELNLGQLIEVTSANPNLEFLWGDVTEHIDPYTGEENLVLGENGYQSLGSAAVEITGDITVIYARIAVSRSGLTYYPDKSITEGPVCNDEEPINPCSCLKPIIGLTQCDSFLQGSILVRGVTNTFIENLPITLIGGGGYSSGMPPTTIETYEPLRISVVYMELNGTSTWFKPKEGEDGEVGKIGEGLDRFIQIDGQSQLDVTVKVSFIGDPVPDGELVQVVIDASSGVLSKLTAQANLVVIVNSIRTEINPHETASYANVTIFPTATPETAFEETVRLVATYDRDNKTVRHIWDGFTVEVVKEFGEDTDDIEGTPSLDPKPPSIYSGSLEIYNIVLDSWSIKSSMSHPRGNLNLELARNKLYAIGGVEEGAGDQETTKRPSRYVEVYDPLYDTWVEAEQMPTARFSAMSAVVGRKIYVMGGIKVDEQTLLSIVSSDVEVFDTDTGTWTTLSSMPTVNAGTPSERTYGVGYGVAQYVIVGTEERIYVLSGAIEIRGQDEIVVKYNDRVLYYVVGTDTWNYTEAFDGVDAVLYQRISPVGFVDGTGIIVSNGVNQIPRSSDMIYKTDAYEYDTATDTLSVADDNFVELPTNRTQPGYASNDTDHYVLGGTTDNSQYTNDLQVIDSNVNPYTRTDLANMLTSKTGVAATAGEVDYSSVVLADGPIAYWRLGGSVGTVYDEMRNSNGGKYNGTLAGDTANITRGQDGLIGGSNKCFQFDNSVGIGYIGGISNDLISPTQPIITVEFWINPDVYDNFDGFPVLSSDTGFIFDLYQKDGSLKVDYFNEGGDTQESIAAVSSNTISHIVISLVYDNSDPDPVNHSKTFISYINTVREEKIAFVNIVPYNIGSELWIGSNSYGDKAVGFLDEVAVYDRLLTPAEVQNHYNWGIEYFQTNASYDSSAINNPSVYTTGGFISGRGEGFQKIHWSFL